MTVRVSRRLLDYFKRYAKRAYPLEAYAIVIGRMNGETARVTQLYIPDDQAEYATRTRIRVPDGWWAQAHRLALNGEEILGDIHSHPEKSKFEQDASPSEADYDRHNAALQGVCSIRKYPSGRMLARIKFWPARAGVVERITK